MTPLSAEIVTRFNNLIQRARQTSLKEPTAMTLATSGSDGRPAARIVLLREFDERGFVFYTNTNSDKAFQIEQNPQLALCFHWDELAEQVRVEGRAELVPDQEADAYWKGRARESQIGAWASRQSETLDSRDTLEQRIRDVEAEFLNHDVPRPEFWSGYRVVAGRVEFWTSRCARLHDRVVYELQGESWTERMLYP